MKTIMVLASNDGGLYHFRLELLKALLERYKVICCMPKGDYTEQLISIGCEFVPCEVMERRGHNPFSDYRLLRFYKSIITDLKPDVVLSYTIKPNVYGGMACMLRRVPYIVNITGLGTSIENNGILRLISKALYKIGLKKATCVFFQNDNNRKTFEQQRIFRGNARLIPGSGVNLENNNYEEYPEETEELRFLFVGRMMKDKGIEELIDAFSMISQEHKNIKLDLVGKYEEDYQDLIFKAEKEGGVVFHGLQREVHPFYKNCHCVVLPSYHEGMANVLLEAAATGRPVIASDIPGCRETFEDGVTGFGCEVKSINSLYEVMNRFVELPHEKKAEMGREARKKMEREFDRQIVIDAYLEEIEAILHSD